jgi:hypothetical protein
VIGLEGPRVEEGNMAEGLPLHHRNLPGLELELSQRPVQSMRQPNREGYSFPT